MYHTTISVSAFPMQLFLLLTVRESILPLFYARFEIPVVCIDKLGKCTNSPTLTVL